eukprot:CAMPEP_0178913414 /NCGR_PEP_ID=MMETSP0786-20121207/10828_1 /TAXON_ID=186022 /ORGANISM="Thalassionema frauenfeldii, Strain CCMP 1798" /LENGTH=146 /DNA_ID=CAMNT_0020586151 /DNA_START=75 /DNA_END=515 /DNA_ORIENTATION=+
MKLPIVTFASLFLANTNAFVAKPATCLSLQRAAVSSAPKTVRYMSGNDALVNSVKEEIDSNTVVVYSKTFCPFCKMTKVTLENQKIDAKVIELDEVDDGPAIQDILTELSGQRTVPNVFVNGKHLGGNDDTQDAVKSGKLKEMLGM